MGLDARLATNLPSHPKTKKLIRRLGKAAAWNLVCLILWTASNRSDGNLSGMTDEDIELSADWDGDDGQFVATLVEVKFLDGSKNCYCLHDWEEHNPWAAGAEARSAKARWNAAKRHHGIAEADRLVPEYAATRNASSNASSNTPSPSPSPSPIVEDKSSTLSTAKLPTCPAQEVIDLYHSALPELPSVVVQSPDRQKAMGSFWKWVLTSKRSDGQPRATDKESALSWINEYFLRARDNDFLMGRTNQSGRHANWRCDFDFLLTEKGKKHVIEKTQVAA